MATVELEIPPRSVYVGVVRLAVASLARAAGLDEGTVYDLKIAVSEACATAVLGLEDSGADEPITITFSESETSLELVVADRARSTEGDPADSQGFDTRSTMSLALLESLVDHCEISPRDGGGSITRLTVAR
ncbi:MAG TPA: ATP-binding protein [Actinomycetota bacterium]|jgi:serine/threonine-protein kinase RsbW